MLDIQIIREVYINNHVSVSIFKFQGKFLLKLVIECEHFTIQFCYDRISKMLPVPEIFRTSRMGIEQAFLCNTLNSILSQYIANVTQIGITTIIKPDDKFFVNLKLIQSLCKKDNFMVRYLSDIIKKKISSIGNSKTLNVTVEESTDLSYTLSGKSKLNDSTRRPFELPEPLQSEKIDVQKIKKFTGGDIFYARRINDSTRLTFELPEPIESEKIDV